MDTVTRISNEYSLLLIDHWGIDTKYSIPWKNLVLSVNGSNNAVKILTDQFSGRITGAGTMVFPSKDHWLTFLITWGYDR